MRPKSMDSIYLERLDSVEVYEASLLSLLQVNGCDIELICICI